MLKFLFKILLKIKLFKMNWISRIAIIANRIKSTQGIIGYMASKHEVSKKTAKQTIDSYIDLTKTDELYDQIFEEIQKWNDMEDPRPSLFDVLQKFKPDLSDAGILDIITNYNQMNARKATKKIAALNDNKRKIVRQLLDVIKDEINSNANETYIIEKANEIIALCEATNSSVETNIKKASNKTAETDEGPAFKRFSIR
jgi:hypothetical protein